MACMVVFIRNPVCRLPRPEDGNNVRSRRPRFDGTCDPPTPKLSETNDHFVPTSTNFGKAGCFGGKVRAVVLKTDLPLRRKNLSVFEVLRSRSSVAPVRRAVQQIP